MPEKLNPIQLTAVALCTLLAVGLGLPSVAAADPPTREPNPLPTVINPFTDTLGNNPCGFPVRVDITTNKEINTTRTSKNGVTTIQTTGALKVRLTNTDSGKAIDRNISGPIHSTVNSDGSIIQKGTGPALWVLDPGVAPGLPRLIISKGKTESVLGPQTGAFRFITPPQSSFENLCAALA